MAMPVVVFSIATVQRPKRERTCADDRSASRRPRLSREVLLCGLKGTPLMATTLGHLKDVWVQTAPAGERVSTSPPSMMAVMLRMIGGASAAGWLVEVDDPEVAAK